MELELEVDLLVLGRRRSVPGTGAIAVTRLWGNELNSQVERVTGDWSRKEDDERLGAKGE